MFSGIFRAIIDHHASLKPQRITGNQAHNNGRKKALIVGDSIIKNVEGWRLKKRMKSQVSIRAIPGATTKDMIYHDKGYLQDTSDRAQSFCSTERTT